MMFLGRGNYKVEPRASRALHDKDLWIIEKTKQEAHKIVNQFRGKDLQTIKFQVRRVFPFGDRRGRTYKIWNREVHKIFKTLDEGTFEFSE